jgi:hypothetical protein
MQNVNANDNSKYQHVFSGTLPLTGNGGKSPSDENKWPGLHSDRLKSGVGVGEGARCSNGAGETMEPRDVRGVKTKNSTTTCWY